MSVDVRQVAISCPHCKERIEIGLVLAVEGATSSREDAERPRTKEERAADAIEHWRANLLPQDRELIELAESNGILTAFMQAWDTAFPTNRPRVPGESLLMFLHHMQPLDLRSRELSMTALAIRSQFGNKKVAVFAWNRITALVVEDILSAFVPLNLLKRPQMSKGSMKVQDIGFQMDGLNDWIKTRNGYVPASGGTFFAEMQKRSPGAFANLGNL
jgi:hypothetical protein